jgi:hypothetical protein
MLKLAKWYGVFLLVLPCVAQAYTVEITSASHGTMQPDNTFLSLLGMTPPAIGGALPYTLTIASFVDTEAPGYTEDLFNYAARSDPTQVEVDFTLGGQSFHYAGQGGVFLHSKQYGYTHEVSFFLPQSPSVEIFATHFDDIPGSTLNPVSLDDVGPRDVSADASLYARLDQNTPGAAVSMGATVAGFSMHTVSPVPEPPRAGMLAGGLALLMWRAARRRGGNQPAVTPVNAGMTSSRCATS